MRDLSQNKSKVIGDIEHRKFFKILFLKRAEKWGFSKGVIYVQDRFLILCVSLFIYINHTHTQTFFYGLINPKFTYLQVERKNIYIRIENDVIKNVREAGFVWTCEKTDFRVSKKKEISVGS